MLQNDPRFNFASRNDVQMTFASITETCSKKGKRPIRVSTLTSFWGGIFFLTLVGFLGILF